MQKTNTRNTATLSKTVYIGNLQYNINEKSLKEIFCEYGKVKFVNILKKPGTEKNKGIAFIKMYDAKAAEMAVKELDGAELDGRTVKVSLAKENEQVTQKEKYFHQKEINDKKAREGQDKDAAASPKRRVKRPRGLEELFINTGRV